MTDCVTKTHAGRKILGGATYQCAVRKDTTYTVLKISQQGSDPSLEYLVASGPMKGTEGQTSLSDFVGRVGRRLMT
jgi:hypothetical protein